MTRAVSAFLALAVAAAAVAAAQAPPVVSVTMRVPDGRTTFFIGEVIPLELEFRGTGNAELAFLTATYDRSGRISLERYDVSPANGHRDPLADYYGTFAVIGGGLRSLHPLDGRPLAVRVTLNEWVQFTQPGRFEVRAISSRLQHRSLQAVRELRAGPVAVTIEAPPPGWTERELQRAIRLVDEADTRAGGVRILRHLGTREAAETLMDRAAQLVDGFHFEVLAGLVGSPFRADVVAGLEARIDVPGSSGDLARLLDVLRKLPR